MFKKYLLSNSHRYTSQWIVLGIDLVIFLVAFLLSYLVRFNFSINFDVEKLIIQLPLVSVTAILSFLITGSYKGVVRHTGTKDVYNIFNAVCLSSIMSILIVMFNRLYDIIDAFTIPLSIVVIHSLIGFILLMASRFIFKAMFYNIISNFKDQKYVMIYGAGESGILTFNAISSNTKNITKVIGYIDDNSLKVGKYINGARVFSSNELNNDFLRKNQVSEIIFSVQNISISNSRKILKRLTDFDVKVKIVPPVEDWINGELKVSQIKEVQIEDLLNRTPIDIKSPKISNELNNKVIFVTGAAGSIGSEIVRQIVKYNYKTLVLIDQAESALYDLQQELKHQGFHNFIPIVADIRDKNRMDFYFREHKPNVLFHAAAYKHVPLMEYNSYEAIKVNIAGTKSLADLSNEHEVDKFVLISTDKAVNPTNVMGATKRLAEMYISCAQQEGKTKFITTRFGNVLGSNGSVIPLFKKQIDNGGPLTVTHREVTRFFMTISEASQLVLEAGAMGKGGEIFIFDMGESVKIFDLAKNMIKLSGLRYPDEIDIKITGLRPGEKLFEELLANGEDVLPTYHKKIMISKVRALDYDYVRSRIDELCVSNMFFNTNTVKLMKEIMPEFISNNSDLCSLDEKKVVNFTASSNEKKISNNLPI